MGADGIGGVKAARGVVDRVRLSVVYEVDEVLFFNIVHVANGVPVYWGSGMGNSSFDLGVSLSSVKGRDFASEGCPAGGDPVRAVRAPKK